MSSVVQPAPSLAVDQHPRHKLDLPSQARPEPDRTPNAPYHTACWSLHEDPHIMSAKVAKIGFMDKKFHLCLTLSGLNRGS